MDRRILCALGRTFLSDVNAYMKTFSFCAFLSEGRWSNFEVLRICLCIAIILILGRRSGMVVVKAGHL